VEREGAAVFSQATSLVKQLSQDGAPVSADLPTLPA
jgi:hypothetical protein